MCGSLLRVTFVSSVSDVCPCLSCIFLFGLGYGGGFMERDEVVEYIERNDSDDEFDEVIHWHCLFCLLAKVAVFLV